MKLVYIHLLPRGGIADYAREQVRALLDAGVDLHVVTVSDAADWKWMPEARMHRIGTSARGGPGMLRKLSYAWQLISRMRRAAETAGRLAPDAVLLSSYLEYFSPFWAGSYRFLQRRGVKVAAVVHDPIRDFQLGPKWWHHLSVVRAYGMMDVAFVHSRTSLPGSEGNPRLAVQVLPHGVYRIAESTEGRTSLRERLGLPHEAVVFLGFGHLRDNKNVELFLQAMTRFPNVWLVIAGKGVSGTQKPVEHYQEMARKLGVDNRCRWLNRFIPEPEAASLHRACDYVLLTYAASYHSASAAFSVSAGCRKLALASDGGGPLTELVDRYSLGVVVEPDSAEAVAHGIKRLLARKVEPSWDAYEAENSWQTNAHLVLTALAR